MIKRTNEFAGLAACAFAFLGFSTPAAAVQSSFSFDYACDASSNDNCPAGTGAVSATSLFEFFSGSWNSQGDLYLKLTFTNTTPAPTTSVLTGIGFDYPLTVGDFVYYDKNGTVYTKLIEGGEYNNGGALVDLCIRSANNANANGPCQAGAGSSGITAPNSATVYFAFDLLPTKTFDDFLTGFQNGYASGNWRTCVRFQTINNPGAVTGGSAVACATIPDEPQETPEPGTLALLGAGLIGLAFARRRRHA